MQSKDRTYTVSIILDSVYNFFYFNNWRKFMENVSPAKDGSKMYLFIFFKFQQGPMIKTSS